MQVRLLLMDLDGVLTDNVFHVNALGERAGKNFHARDGRALRALREAGWQLHVVTASDWGGAVPYLSRFPVTVWADHAKTPATLHAVTGGMPYVAVGDDVFDLHMLRGAERAFCPSDADPEVLAMEGIQVLRTPGGRGVISEIARHLIFQSEGERHG